MGIFVCFVATMALILPEANGCSKQTEVHAGSSRNNKVKIVQHFKPISSCPSTITKAERTNTDYSDANDMFNVTVIDGKGKLRVERIDGTDWGMDLKFQCCAGTDNTVSDCEKSVEVHVSSSKIFSKTVDAPMKIRRCPVNVTMAERTNTDFRNAPDTFRVSVIEDDTKVRVTRIDGDSWLMDLRFKCCGYGDYFKTPSNDCEMCLGQLRTNEWCVAQDGVGYCFNFFGEFGHPNGCSGVRMNECDRCTKKTTCKSCHVSICVGGFPSFMLVTSIVLLCILFLTTYKSTLFFSGISRM